MVFFIQVEGCLGKGFDRKPTLNLKKKILSLGRFFELRQNLYWFGFQPVGVQKSCDRRRYGEAQEISLTIDNARPQMTSVSPISFSRAVRTSRSE